MCVCMCLWLGALFAVGLLFFGDLAVQLLQNQSVKRDSLLRVIKYPISRYLPVNSRKIGEAMLYEFSCIIYSITRNEVNICFDNRILI
jgi:hypothetical protein